jgi:hypothetical protein
MRVVIVGNSPLAFFIAQGLNNDIARFAHVEVVWLTDDREMTYLPTYRLLSPNRAVRKSAALPNIRIVTEPIRSISLPNRRIVTQKRLLEFDILCLDQTPWYTSGDLSSISQALQKLSVQLRLKKDIRAAGAVRLKGASPLAWQLALLVRAEINRHKFRQISVEVERPKNRVVTEFLRSAGIDINFSTRPGFSVAPPEPAFPSKRVKGMRIDRREMAITNNESVAARGVLVVEQLTSSERTLWRALESEARQYAGQIERMINSDELSSLEREPAAYLLKSTDGILLRFDRTVSQRVRAHLVAKLDRDLWKKLLSRHG